MALALAELEGCLQSKRLVTVDKDIPEGFDSLLESRVASHPPQFDQSLAFKRRCLSPVAIVFPKGVKTGRQRAFRANSLRPAVASTGTDLFPVTTAGRLRGTGAYFARSRPYGTAPQLRTVRHTFPTP